MSQWSDARSDWLGSFLGLASDGSTPSANTLRRVMRSGLALSRRAHPTAHYDAIARWFFR
ncbi:MAG: hypothetical protein Q8Q09_25800 [Deltaproteobacteria bacterium]|nr:hypothetical protein [Deltaproteobacteria bacterium]